MGHIEPVAVQTVGMREGINSTRFRVTTDGVETDAKMAHVVEFEICTQTQPHVAKDVRAPTRNNV